MIDAEFEDELRSRLQAAAAHADRTGDGIPDLTASTARRPAGRRAMWLLAAAAVIVALVGVGVVATPRRLSTRGS